MRIATLPMYDLPEVRWATDELWTAIAERLTQAGENDVPARLDRDASVSHEDAWRSPELLFSQTCGFPLTHAFRGKLRVVATPSYDVAGCEGGDYHSVVVVPARAATRALDDLRARDVLAVAINDATSHSGSNVLRATLGTAVFARARVDVTGSHLASVAAVARGAVDVAAIDCVTHALIARWRPSALDGTRVVGATCSAPSLPYVTRGAATDADLARLRAALEGALADTALASARAALLLRGANVTGEDAYDRILAIEGAAIA